MSLGSMIGVARPDAGGGRRNLLERVVMVVTVIVALVFAATIEGFATLGNLSVILSNSAALVILSCGMAVVIISRGLDLSLIAGMVAGATCFSILIDAGYGGPESLLLAIGAMAAVGIVNAWLIAYVEIPAMLATLASAMFGTRCQHGHHPWHGTKVQLFVAASKRLRKAFER